MHLSGIGFLKSMTDEAPRYKMALKHNTLVHLYLKVDFFLKNLKVYVGCVHTLASCSLDSVRAVQGSKLIENQEVQ